MKSDFFSHFPKPPLCLFRRQLRCVKITVKSASLCNKRNECRIFVVDSPQCPGVPYKYPLIDCAEQKLIMAGKFSSQSAPCIQRNSHVNSPLVLGKFVAINVIGSLNPFDMPAGKHYVAAI